MWPAISLQKADLLVDRFRATHSFDNTTSSVTPSTLAPSEYETPGIEGFDLENIANSSLLSRLTEEESAVFQNALAGSSGVAFAFDSFGELEDTGTDGGMAFDWLDFGDAGGL